MFKVMKSFICRGCVNPAIKCRSHKYRYWCQCQSGISG